MIIIFEKVNPSHPDKVADRIAGAMVDYAYSIDENPRIAVEVLIGHGECKIIAETSVHISTSTVYDIVKRIANEDITLKYLEVPQDVELARNQSGSIKCGDNGIFKGTPITDEQKYLTNIANTIYSKHPFDGKYLINNGKLTICQSNTDFNDLYLKYPNAIINPLGYWTGGISVDSGATNRKLGSDMGDGVTGGGLNGKDLSKADVTLNICAFLEAQETGNVIEWSCSIGDEEVNGRPYSEYVEIARNYIKELGGFEKFSEWGLVRV